MPSRTTAGSILTISVVRAAYGTALLLAPERLISLGTHRPVPASARAFARVLGARHLVQAVVSIAAPTGRVLGGGAVVDALHGSSQVALAAVAPRWRTAALADAALASLLIAAVRVASGRRPDPL